MRTRARARALKVICTARNGKNCVTYNVLHYVVTMLTYFHKFNLPLENSTTMAEKRQGNNEKKRSLDSSSSNNEKRLYIQGNKTKSGLFKFAEYFCSTSFSPFFVVFVVKRSKFNYQIAFDLLTSFSTSLKSKR